MSWTVVVERQSGRLVYARRKELVVGLDALFPATAYNYVWLAELKQEVRADPWDYAYNSAGALLLNLDRDAKAYSFQAQKADKLVVLARVIEKHRRYVMSDVAGQDLVYAEKVKEAQQVRSGAFAADQVPFLTQSAQLFGHTIADEANLVLFRHQQRLRVLLDTEERRRHFQLRILRATAEVDLSVVHQEIQVYERTSSN